MTIIKIKEGLNLVVIFEIENSTTEYRESITLKDNNILKSDLVIILIGTRSNIAMISIQLCELKSSAVLEIKVVEQVKGLQHYYTCQSR